jgi:hypothetical protein
MATESDSREGIGARRKIIFVPKEIIQVLIQRGF